MLFKTLKEKSSYLEFFAVLAFMAIGNSLFAILSADTKEYFLLFSALKSAILFLVLLILMLNNEFYRKKIVKEIKISDLLNAIVVFAIFYFSALIGKIVSEAFLGQSVLHDLIHVADENVKISITQKELVLCAIFAISVALLEELFYRFYVYFFFLQRGLPFYVGIIVSVLLFSCGHLYQGLQGFLSAFLMGLATVLAVTKNVSFFSLVLAHSIYDFCVIVASFV